MTPNLSSQLRLTPRIVFSSQESAVNFSSFIALQARRKSAVLKVLFQRVDRFCLRQIPPHALEKRHTVPLICPRQYPVRRGFAYTIRDHFEALADVDDKGARYVGYIDPLAALIEGLEALDMWRRSLEQECPPS